MKGTFSLVLSLLVLGIASVSADTYSTSRALTGSNKGAKSKSAKSAKSKRSAKGSKSKTGGKKKTPPPILVFCNIGSDELGIIHTKTDDHVLIPLKDISGWPYPEASANTQHAAISPDGKTVYIATISNGDNSAAAVVTIDFDLPKSRHDFKKLTADDFTVDHVSEYASATTTSDFDPYPVETDPKQPIEPWTLPAYAQVHGPTFRKGSPYMYWGTWTSHDMIVLDTRKDKLKTKEYAGFSDHSHGFVFSPDARKAIGSVYTYDSPYVVLYKFKSRNPFPVKAKKIPLGPHKNNKFGSKVHYAYWLNNRFAYVATMQLGETSLTPSGQGIQTPSVYLIDTKKGTATKVGGTANMPEKEGVWNSASDTVIANGKLYVSEEETMDVSPGSGLGSVSIWYINHDLSLTFKKRLYDGSNDGVPPGFAVGHGSSVSYDGKFVYVFSYASNHVIKVNTITDVVDKVWDGENDGMSAPHGSFIAGNDR